MKKILTVTLIVAVVLLALSGCVKRKNGLSWREVAQEMEKIETNNAATPVPITTVATNQTGNSVAFASTGDPISGWYWLRDSALKQYAEWTVKGVPQTGSLIEVAVEALATNRASDGRGFDAEFTVYYGLPSNKDNLSLMEKQVVTLPNISPESDPVGYTCQGKFFVPHLLIGQNDELYIKILRGAESDNHIAVNQGSIVSLKSADQEMIVR